jgi:hypothetical protein
MLSDPSRNGKLLQVLERTRQYARVLEDREKQDRKFGLLLFLLAVSIATMAFLLIRRFA